MEGKEQDVGIAPRVFSQIFEAIQASSNLEYLVRASYLEIYNEEIHDLLDRDSKSKLELKESKDGAIYCKNLRSVAVESVSDMNKILRVRPDFLRLR